MDNFTYAIERARLKALIAQRDEAKAKGHNNRYADLVREVRSSEEKLQSILGAGNR
ncbi:hypothetical protein [Pseudonocardia acidicola]|uniref:Uncharacterized protein n=1 Tax=Pseudonocardia acidicola TaxID=2724939 RepID=A0ABX1SBU7_9PSEU|nr:hypothetical protein [Pseudonocardia acidicola]NMH99036.1 hypothetical protein [Pseudonocardia acidicola]